MLKEMQISLHVKGLLFLYEDNQDSNGLMHTINTFHCQSLLLSIQQFLGCFLQIHRYHKDNGSIVINFSYTKIC